MYIIFTQIIHSDNLWFTTSTRINIMGIILVVNPLQFNLKNEIENGQTYILASSFNGLKCDASNNL